MNVYDRYLLPWLLDLACGIGPVQEQRRKVVPQAAGRVLEVGVGTGRNMPFYTPQCVASLDAVDPGSPLMQRVAQRRAARNGLDLHFAPLSAEELPYDSGGFDTVVCTYTLCTIPDAAAALAQMRRVLKPEGRLLFCEHGAAPDAGVRRWQDRITPAWKRIAGGCHLNRDVPALLREGGFSTVTLDTGYIRGPRPWTFHYRGVATPAG